ncbi:hypothetical protein B0H10DRAFT_2198810 [Mycena sp. CBHHK59/15]|nr:hypothetical protein B0H10DRAFT_2198810 [Mycena sp. CBHHK59/15]
MAAAPWLEIHPIVGRSWSAEDDLNAVQSLVFFLAMLSAPAAHLWSFLAGFLPSATISQEHEVFCWVHAWVKQNATSRALLIEDQIKRGQLSGRLTPDIARGVLTRYGGRLLWIKLDDVPKGPQIHIIVLSIFPGGRSLFSQLLDDSRRAFEAGDGNDTITVFTPGLHKHAWAYPSELDRRPWESVHLPEKDELLEDILKFEESGDFYQQFGIPWRRGYLLHGAPGTGKTSLVKALAGLRKRALYIVNLGDEGLTDGDLRTLLERVPRSAMILIEDLTGISTERKKDHVQGVTLSGLLNALDGVTAPERGVTFFVTTNDIGGLDTALTRPGRLGYHLKFHSATSVQIHSMLAAHYPGSGHETFMGHILSNNSCQKTHPGYLAKRNAAWCCLTKSHDPMLHSQFQNGSPCTRTIATRSFNGEQYFPTFSVVWDLTLLAPVPHPLPSVGDRMGLSPDDLGKCNNPGCNVGCGAFYLNDEDALKPLPAARCLICNCYGGQHVKVVSLSPASSASSVPPPASVPKAVPATTSTLHGSRPAPGPFRALAEQRQVNIQGSLGTSGHPFHPAKQSQVEGDLNPYNSKAKKRKRKSSTNAAEKPGPNVSVTAAKKNLKLYNVTLVEGTKAVAEGRYKKPGPTKLNDLADEDYIQPVSIADDATPEDIAAAAVGTSYLLKPIKGGKVMGINNWQRSLANSFVRGAGRAFKSLIYIAINSTGPNLRFKGVVEDPNDPLTSDSELGSGEEGGTGASDEVTDTSHRAKKQKDDDMVSDHEVKHKGEKGKGKAFEPEVRL